VTVEVRPLEGIPEVRPGDDLAAMLERPLRALGVRDADVVAITQKVVSKAEGRIVPSGVDRRAWVERETARVVARRGDLVIAATRHGFVCANAGVDASNVEEGFVSLLPENPDASAERLRATLARRLGVALGVVITDTFGRPWRQGLVNVAIGCSGMPALVDLRGSPDHHGRALEATVVALADEVAAASGLVMTKGARVPATLVRGVDTASAAAGRAADLVRAPEDDLFREAPLLAISARRTIRSFGPGAVPEDVLEEAIRAACTAPAPHRARPWRFSIIASADTKRALRVAMAAAWGEDLRKDGTPEDEIASRTVESDSVLGAATVLIVPWISFASARPYPDEEREHAEQETFLLSGGAAIQNLLLALHAQGFASCWISSSIFCQTETRVVLQMSDEWFALGTVAVGPMPAGWDVPEGGAAPPRPPIDLDAFAGWR
jgi:dehydro coenzyme F420 reductase / coenzyme F420-0:L-glutamate ligase / coenzyme F420-1:gamma-L-glutamate ligase